MDNPSIRPYALVVTTLAAFLVPFMSSSINLALPAIGQDLRANALAVTWVGSAYLLPSAALLLPCGRAGDLYGRRKIFLVGLVIYVLASILAALAGSVAMLIAARAIQGVGGAMIFGTAVAILTSVFPPDRRGRVLGINVASVYTGLSLGPVLGGLMTQDLGWRSLFVLNVVLALIALALAWWKLRGEWGGDPGQSFDWPGAALLTTGLLLLLYGISTIRSTGYGRWLALAGVVGLAAFTWVQLRAPSPLLDLRRFRGNLIFIFSNLAALIHYSATFAVTFLLSNYLQLVQGLEPRQAGLILLAQPVVMAALSPLTGWLSERVEPRLLSSGGMGLMAGGLLGFSMLGTTTSIALIVGISLLLGLGYACFSSPNTNAVMGAVAMRQYGVASATLGTMRQVGQALSMAIVLLLVSIYVGPVQLEDPQALPGLLTTVTVGFRLFTGLCLLGMVASLARGKVQR